MSTPHDIRHLLVLPRLRVQNANAISSPLTHGFPAITAFMGLMWALERKAKAQGMDIQCQGIGLVCHAHQELVTDEGHVRSFRLTRNPPASKQDISKFVNKSKPPSIVEEGRIHLELSLVIAVQSAKWRDDPDAAQNDADRLGEFVSSMRVAGGSLLPRTTSGRHPSAPMALHLTGTEEQQAQVFRELRKALLPGFALVARDDLLETRWTEMKAETPEVSKLDAWLSLARINWRYHPPTDDSPEARSKAWQSDRKGLGWVVPIPVGYGKLGELQPPGTVANTRDTSTPFRFVESVYSVGQWVSPHRLQDPLQLLWFADHDPEAGLYRCRNHYAPAADQAEDAFDFS